MKVYIAGASAEASRCKALGEWVQRFGAIVTFEWWVPVLAAKVPDRELDEKARTNASFDDLLGVANADVVWLAIPEDRGVGAWVEFGFTLGAQFGAFRAGEATEPPRKLIVSGDWRKSIFTAMAHERFDTHEEALAWIVSRINEEAA